MSDFSIKGSGGLVADSDSKKKSQKEWHMLAYVIFYLYLCSRFGKRAHRWDGLNGINGGNGINGCGRMWVERIEGGGGC